MSISGYEESTGPTWYGGVSCIGHRGWSSRFGASFPTGTADSTEPHLCAQPIEITQACPFSVLTLIESALVPSVWIRSKIGIEQPSPTLSRW